MIAIDRIPEEVLDILLARGIDANSILLAAHADRTREHTVGDEYLFATNEQLIVLHNKETADGNPVLTTYPIKELRGISVEELLSSGRLVAKRGEENTPILVAAFTNFYKESMFLFAKYANKIAAGEELVIDEKDDPASKLCPKCGLRYPDLNRRICPHCMEKGKLFRRFSVFLLRYRASIIITMVSLAVMTALSILAPYLSSGFFYDEVIYGVGEFAGQILLVLGLIIATRLLKTLVTMVNNYVTSRIAAKMVFDLKKTIFSAIERLSLSFFTGRQTGGLMTQINEDANTIYSFFCDGVPYMLINIVQVIVLAILLFTMQPLLALLSLITVPAFLLFIKWMYRRQRMYHARRFAGSKQMNSFLADVFSGMRVVKAFSKEDVEIARFTTRNQNLAKSEKQLALFSNYGWPVAYQLLYLGNIVAWGVGGWMIISGAGGMTYGTLLTFIAYMNMIYSPLEFFVHFFDMTADCSNALQRLFEIMDAEPDVVEKENPERPESLGGSVEFENVSFSYQKGRKIIDGVTFNVPDGHVLGIVGHTGAGKSTLANLLMRMYDVDEGEIRIGGYPVRDLELATLYRHIAIVSQETYLFMGTILENIRYARPDATFEEVVEAAKCAGAHDFIMSLPNGYDTYIGERGVKLSGGQKQRLSIARVFVKNPPILILDEATSALDNESELIVQKSLEELAKNRTTLTIAHRLTTIKNADRIIVLTENGIEETGTHEELINLGGKYADLYKLYTR